MMFSHRHPALYVKPVAVGRGFDVDRRSVEGQHFAVEGQGFYHKTGCAECFAVFRQPLQTGVDAALAVGFEQVPFHFEAQGEQACQPSFF